MAGREIALTTNHYEMIIDPPNNGKVFHYDASFSSNNKKEWKKNDRPILVQAIEAIKKKYSNLFSNPHEVVFDGQRNVFSLNELPLGDADAFVGHVKLKESRDLASETLLTVTMKKVGIVHVKDLIDEYVITNV